MFFATESKLLKLNVICIIMLFNNTLIEDIPVINKKGL